MDFDLDALPELDADGKPVGQEVDLDALPELDADGKPVEEQKKSLGIFGTLGAQTDLKAGRKTGTLESIAENTPVVGQVMDANYNRQWHNLKRLYEGDFNTAIEARVLAHDLGFSDEDLRRIDEEAGYGGKNLLGNYTKFDLEKGKALFKELVGPEFTKRLQAREAAQQQLTENDLNWVQKGVVGGVGATKLLGSMANAPLAAATLGIDATNRAAEQLAGKWILDENGQPTKIWWKTDANGEPVRDEAGNLVPREEVSQDMAVLKGITGAATERFIWMGLGKATNWLGAKAIGKMEQTAAGAKVSEALAKATSGTMKGVQEATEWLGKTSTGRAVLNVGKAIGWLNSKGKFGSIPDMMVKSRIQELADNVVGLAVADPADRESFSEWAGKFFSVKENAELFTEMLAMHLAMKAGGASFKFAGRGLEKIRRKEAREFDRKSAIGRRVEETVAELVGEERAAKLTDKDLVNLYRIVTSDGFTAERAEQFAEKVAGDVDEAQKLIDEGASLSSLAEGLKARRQYSDQFVEGAKAAAAELRDRVTLDGAQSAKINDAALKAAEGNVEIAAKVAALAKSRLTNKHTQVDDANGLESLVAEAMRPFAPEARAVKIHDMKGNRNVGEQLTALEELGITSVEDAELNGVVRRDENGHLTGGARQAVNIAAHGTDALKAAVKDGSIDAATAEALITTAHTEMGTEAPEARAELVDGILGHANGDAALARRMAEIVGEAEPGDAISLDTIAERAKASLALEEPRQTRLDEISGCKLSSIEGGVLGCNRFRSMSAQFGESTDEAGNVTKKLSVKGLGEGQLAKPGNWADGAVLVAELARIAEKNGAVLDFGSVEASTEAAGLLNKIEREGGLEKAKAKLETRAKLFDVLARSALDTGVTFDEASFRKALAETGNGRRFVDNHGNIYGFKSADGTLHFNPAQLDYNIPIHEYGHLALESLKGVNRKLWERGMELVKGSDYYKSIKEQAETEGHEYGYLKGDDAGICDEALATLIGDNGEKLVEAQGVGAELKAWLKDFWAAFKGAFGLADMTDAQIEKLTLGQFVDAVNAELLRGKEFGTRKAMPLEKKSIKRYDEAQGSGSNGMLRWKNDRGRLFYIPVDMERTQPGGKVVLATDNANITDWIQGRLNGYTLRMSRKGKIYVEGRDGLEGELAEIFGRYPKAGMNDGIGEELASVLHNDSLREATPDKLVEMLTNDRANYDEWVKATRDGKGSLEDAKLDEHYADEAERAEYEARRRWEDSGMDVPEYILSRIEDGEPGFDLEWETMREAAHDEAEGRFAVGGKDVPEERQIVKFAVAKKVTNSDGGVSYKVERDGQVKRYKTPKEALEDFVKELDGVEMNAEQQGIYDVATGVKKTTDIRKNDLGELVKLHKGGRNKGANKIIAVHYAGKRGKVTAKEVINMGLVIRNGKLTFDGNQDHPNARRYEATAEDGARLRLIIDLDKQGNEAVINLYSDRKDGNPGHEASSGAETTSSSGGIIANSGDGAQGGRSLDGVTPEEDAAYADAVKRGDKEAYQRMLRDVAARRGYSDDSSYQGTSAFNGAAPSRNAYFETKQERIEATKRGEMEDTTTLGDFRDGIDVNNLEFIVFDPRSERTADPKRQEAIRNIRGVLDGNKQTITMYRSVPANVKETQFRNGDWITPSRAYAEENARIHGWGDKYRVIEQEVSVEDVWWDGNDIAEWGFDDGRGSVYKNTAFNRKLLEPTYDDAGNLIPLSKRFNDWKNDIRFAVGGQSIGDWIIGADGTIARRGTPQAAMIGGARVADDAGRGEQTPGSMAAALERLNAPRTTMRTIGTVRPTSLPLSEMEFLRKYLTGDHLPAKIAKKIAGGKIAAHTKAGRLTIAADVFGLVDKTDVAPAKDRLKEHGFFRNEDEAWAANHSEVEVRQERERSEAQLGDELLKIADRRARGVEAGGESAARGVYANELAKIVMDMPRKEGGVIGRVQKIGDAVRTNVKALMAEKGGAKGAMAEEAKRFLDWARGGAEPEGAAQKTDREITDEMFASWLVMPEEMGKLAPTWSEAILRTVAETPKLAEAFKELSYRALSKDSHKAVFEAVRKSQTLAVEKALKELEADRTEKISAGSRIADAKEKIIVTFHDTMGAVAVRIDEKTRQYLAARRKVLAEMKARGATKSEIAAVENEIDIFAQKIGHLKNRMELSRTAMERGTWNEGRRYMLQYLLLENKATKKWGLTEEDKSAYLDMMRVVETQGRASSYGMDPRQARLALGDMARRLGAEKWARLEEYGREFFSVMEREFLNDPRVERMWGKGMIDYFRTQAHYVTTKRVHSQEELDAIETARAKAKAAGVNGGDDVIGAMFTYAGPRGGASALGLNESAWKAKLTGSMGAKQEVRSATWEKQQMLMQSARRNQFVLDLRDALLAAKVEGVRDVERGAKDVKPGSRYGAINYVENGVRRTLIVPAQIAEGMKVTPDNMPWLTKFHNAARGLMIDWNYAYWNRNIMRNSGSIEKNMPGMHESWLKTVLRVAPGMAPTVDLACQHLARHSKGAARAMTALFGRDTIFPYIQQAGRMAKLLEDPTAWQERLWDAEARGDAAEVAEMHEDLRRTMEMLKGNMFLPNKAAYGNRETQGFANDMMNKAGFRMVAQMQKQAARTRLGRAVDMAKSPFKRNERQQEYEDVLAKSIAYLHDRAIFGAQRSSEESGLVVKRNVSIAEGERKGSESRTIQRYMTQFFNMTEKGVTRTVRALQERPGETLGKMARTWVGRFVGGAMTYGLVTRAIRALYGDDEEKAKASPLGEVYGFAKWIENANKNLSNYVRNHYQTIPLWVSDDGYTTICLGTPLNDEDSLIAPSADFAAKAFANAMGSKNDLALGQMLADTFIRPVTPDLAIATPALKVIRDTIEATMVQNPTDLFTGAPTYDQDLYALRNESWEARGDFALAMARQVWNDVGARGLVAWDRQGVDNGTGAAPKWIGLALKRIPVLSPVLNSFVKVQVGSPEKDAKPIRADEQRLQHVRNYISRKLMIESSEKGGALNRTDPQRYAELLEQWQGEYGLSDHDMRLVEKRFLNGWTEHENEEARRRKVIQGTLRKARKMGIEDADRYMIRGDL